MNPLIIVTESDFARQVLHAPLPVILCVYASWCDASQALLPLLDVLAGEYAGRLTVATLDGEAEGLVAEQYSVSAVPTLLVFEGGEELTRAIGFAPEGLLRLLFAETAGQNLARHWLWSPTEQTFEDVVLIPLLTGWGFHCARQVSCRVQGSGRLLAGRADLVVYTGEGHPLAVFENKRQIASAYDLQQAVAQARGYAQALDLPCFAVAAPTGIWVYMLSGRNTTLVRELSALDLYTRPQALRALLLELGA